MTLIKVCGIKNRETFEQLETLGTDYVGFVFAKSKRQVTAEQAAEIVHAIPRRAKRVGVFVDERPEEIVRIAETAGLDVLQMHGGESPELCRELRERTGLQVWKAWGVRHDERDAALASYQGAVDAVLLDNERGGTGTRFPWEAIPQLRTYVPGVPLFVAGGLHADNVGELLANHAADGVDVSSGVETDGAKDSMKIAQFVRKVRDSE
ncbi:MAG: phosphoribosylanthranilate isomerase [Tumebacillaceae bacterium]